MSAANILLITRLTTQNAGNEALSKELIRFMARKLPSANIRAFDRYPRHLEQFTIKSLGANLEANFDAAARRLAALFCKNDGPKLAVASISDVILNQSGKELEGPLRTWKRKLAIRRRLAALNLIEKEHLVSSVSACCASDLLVWNPAGEIHPTGNPDQVLQLLLLVRIAQLSGSKTAAVNHSLEIADPRLRRLIAHVYRAMDYVAVRDATSVVVAKQIGLDENRVFEAPDLVFLASRDDAHQDIPPDKSRAIGFSINGLEAAKHFDGWAYLLDRLTKLDRPFVYVSNAMNHDFKFSDKLREQFGGKVVDHQPGYKELGELFSGLELLVSSRLHSSILALQEGVPVVSVEPSLFKLTAIFEQMRYPIKTERLSETGWEDRLCANIQYCMDNRHEISKHGLTAISQQRTLIENVYAHLLELVDE